MGLADEPLFQAIVTAHHDPDPERAFRYQPFLYPTARRPEAGGMTGAAGRRAGRARIRLDPVAAVRRLVPGWRSASAPCCAPACC